MINPTIVVIAFNREKSLKRLLDSIANAHYSSDQITLHISIDASENSKVKEVANEFNWTHGEKVVDVKIENHGLLKHVLSCGALTEKYGAIIVLEDDLVVAPNYYNYAIKANDFYCKDDKIAGISLFTYSSEEGDFYPFEPINDGSDVHFIQVASSWGQLWHNDQWNQFNQWLNDNPRGDESLLPDYIRKWDSSSWKKLFVSYMIASDRYFVFPNTSFSTNFEDEGTNASKTGLFQVLLSGSDRDLKLCTWSDSNSVYDVYFEPKSDCIKKINNSFADFDFEVDLYGRKPIDFASSELILTTRRGINSKVSFGSEMKPLFQNLEYNIKGNEIGLFAKSNLIATEENRYLSLVTPSIRFKQYAELKEEFFSRVTIVVPVNSDNIEDLRTTISALPKEQFYNATLLIATSIKSVDAVYDCVNESSHAIDVIAFETNNLGDLLKDGIVACKTEYCGWMQAGMLIELNKLDDVARIFRGMKQVQIIQGVQEETSEQNYLKVNTAKYRWTPKLANLYKQEASLNRSEMIFWRKSIFNNLDTVIKGEFGALYIELLKVNPIYIVATKLGDFNAKKRLFSFHKSDVKNRLLDAQYQPKKGLTSIVRPLFRIWFFLNTPILRLFYKEIENLPLVIRYDYKHDSYYLDNY